MVEAAAGGVGGLLVQLARAAGAKVVGAAGGARKTSLLTGVDLAVDYTVRGWDAVVRDTTGGVDVVFDGVGGEISDTAFRLLLAGGRMVSFGLASGAWAGIDEETAERSRVRLIRPSGSPQELREFTESALHGSLTPVIGQRFPLERAADAHAAIERRATVGKTLLVVRNG